MFRRRSVLPGIALMTDSAVASRTAPDRTVLAVHVSPPHRTSRFARKDGRAAVARKGIAQKNRPAIMIAPGRVYVRVEQEVTDFVRGQPERVPLLPRVRTRTVGSLAARY